MKRKIWWKKELKAYSTAWWQKGIRANQVEIKEKYLLDYFKSPYETGYI